MISSIFIHMNRLDVMQVRITDYSLFVFCTQILDVSKGIGCRDEGSKQNRHSAGTKEAAER